MPDDLRAHIAQRCIGHLSAADVRRILDLAMPLVEQEIRKERHRADEAIDEHETQLCPEDMGCKEYINWLRKALDERDAQIRESILREHWQLERIQQQDRGLAEMRTDLPAVSGTIKRALELTGCVGVADMAAELVLARKVVAQKVAELVQAHADQAQQIASCDVCEYEFEGGDRTRNVVCSQCWPHEVASRLYQLALTEKDRQIRAFHKTIQDFADGTVNVSGTKREAGEVAQIQAVLAVVLSESRSQLLRETPAPPQTQEK